MPRQYRQRTRSRDPGIERALQHIEEARQFSEEVGGTDQDIKSYFFSLPAEELDRILNLYEEKYSRTAREYAEQTMPRWRSGNRKMSGEVAQRLFSLLPAKMPIKDKFKLVESLWKHKGPSSYRVWYIGPDADPEDVASLVEAHFALQASGHTIPEEMVARFEWLAQGDIGIKQQLLNYMQAMEKQVVGDVLQSKIAMLKSQIQTSHAGSFTETIEIGKHKAVIKYNEMTNGISETAPPAPRKTSSFGDEILPKLILAAIVLIVFYALSR